MLKLKNIKNIDFSDKRVLMRVDFNVPFDAQNRPLEKHRILSVKESVDFVLSHKGAKLALVSHLGRPDGRDRENSFAKYFAGISKVLGNELVFVETCFGEGVKLAMDSLGAGQVLMLENVRFYAEDSKNDWNFSKQLADGFDIFVNEGFGAAHRAHSSTAGIASVIPSCAGFNFLKEVAELTSARENKNHPSVAVIGGAKVETKLPVIEFFAKNYDMVLVGGRTAVEAQKGKMTFRENVFLPSDYVGDGDLDIGPKTIDSFSKYLSAANTIVWNGPMGLFEQPPYDRGTSELINSIAANEKSYKIVGGGETVQVLEEGDMMEKMNFVSTGGGAMLEFLAKGTLPAIDVLLEN